MPDEQNRWRHVRSEEGPDYGIFRVRLDWVVSPRTGEESRYVILDCPDWVNVIALTDDDRVVLIREHRHGIDEMALEIPSGTVDRDEEPLAAAQRELAEETGYTSDRWTLLGRVRPNAAFQNNWCYSFLAEGVRLTGEPHFDAGEDIAVELHPLAAVRQLIDTGQIDQAFELGAFYRYYNGVEKATGMGEPG